MSTLSHGASCAHPADSPQTGQAARWGHRSPEGRMAGGKDRWWCTAADLGCLAAGAAAMFFVAARFDVPGRLFSSTSDATLLQQPMLLVSLIALALVSDDLLVRLAGDQFAVLCPNLYDGRHADQVADRVRQALVRPFNVDGERLWLTVCIGMAINDGDADSASSLQRDAEAALLRA